jgi:hypothetical protein
MGDDARRRILERRAKFVAAALGAAAVASNCKAEPCLSAVPTESAKPKPAPEDASVAPADTGPLEQPMPCLSEAPMPPPDAPKPMPCLKIAPPRDAGPKAPKPEVCLDF